MLCECCSLCKEVSAVTVEKTDQFLVYCINKLQEHHSPVTCSDFTREGIKIKLVFCFQVGNSLYVMKIEKSHVVSKPF